MHVEIQTQPAPFVSVRFDGGMPTIWNIDPTVFLSSSAALSLGLYVYTTDAGMVANYDNVTVDVR